MHFIVALHLRWSQRDECAHINGRWRAAGARVPLRRVASSVERTVRMHNSPGTTRMTQTRSASTSSRCDHYSTLQYITVHYSTLQYIPYHRKLNRRRRARGATTVASSIALLHMAPHPVGLASSASRRLAVASMPLYIASHHVGPASSASRRLAVASIASRIASQPFGARACLGGRGTRIIARGEPSSSLQRSIFCVRHLNSLDISRATTTTRSKQQTEFSHHVRARVLCGHAGSRGAARVS